MGKGSMLGDANAIVIDKALEAG